MIYDSLENFKDTLKGEIESRDFNKDFNENQLKAK